VRLDMRSYFRQLRVSCRDRWRLAHVFQGKTWLHLRHAFGGSAAPLIACLLSNAICDIAAQRCPAVRFNVFVDDFVLVALEDDALRGVATLRAILRELSLQENVTKYRPPSAQMTILGVDFDLDAGSISLSPKRRTRLAASLEDAIRLTATAAVGARGDAGHRRRLERLLSSLGGHLSFVTPLFPLSPALTTHIWTAAAALGASGERVVYWRPLTWALRAWRELIHADGGEVRRWSLLRPVPQPSVARGYAEIHTDSCDTGFGAVLWPHGAVIADVWSRGETRALTSNARELWAAVLACCVFVPWLHARGVHVVLLRSDSLVTVCAIAAARCADATLFRPLFVAVLLQWRFQMRVLPLHVPGLANAVPDWLSRQPTAPIPLPRYYRLAIAPRIRALPSTLSTGWPWHCDLDQAERGLAWTPPSGDGGDGTGPSSIAALVASTPATATIVGHGKASSSTC